MNADRRLFEEDPAQAAMRPFPWILQLDDFGRETNPPTQSSHIRGPRRRNGKEMDMKKVIVSICLSLLLPTMAFAGLHAGRFAGAHRCGQGGSGPDHECERPNRAEQHFEVGHMRGSGPEHDKGRVFRGRSVRAGSGYVPHRARLERAGVHPHGRRVLRIPDGADRRQT